MSKYLYVKIVMLVMALVGVLWLMQSLKTEPIGVDSPVKASVRP
jgi:hypothetical protein